MEEAEDPEPPGWGKARTRLGAHTDFFSMLLALG